MADENKTADTNLDDAASTKAAAPGAATGAGGGGASGGGGGAGTDPAGGAGGVTTPPPGKQPPPGGGNGGGRQTFSQWMSTPPGETLVGSGVIVLTSVFLMALTVTLLVGITLMWPACEVPPEAQPSPTPAAVANANGNGNGNANTNANANSNVNGNANRNAAAGANANANTANANANVANANVANANANAVANANASAVANANARGVPSLRAIEPTSGSVLGNTPVTIRVKSPTTKEGLTVRFGEDEAKLTRVTDEAIYVRTPQHSEGVVDVSIWRSSQGADGKAEKVEEDRLPNAYTYVCAAPQGSTLFWMLIMAGALGGCIHALRSLWWYTGQGNLRWKWMLMYYCLPFTGAAMAMLFSLLIVAGLIDNTAGRNQSLFIIAIAGQVGMFTQQAALKLTDIANAVFARPEEGKNANPQRALPATNAGAGEVVRINPASGPAAGGQDVSITETGLTDVASVTFGTAVAPGFTFDAATASVKGVTPPKSPADADDVVVIVTNAAGKPAKVNYKYT
jgi:hypothetical protein